jgi:hypothetical protein
MAKMDLSKLNDFRVFQLTSNAVTKVSIQATCPGKAAYQILVSGPSILVYISIENQQMPQNDHFIVMLSQTLLHVSAYLRHHQAAHMILTSCLHVGVHYRKKNGISSEIAQISIVTLWM